MRSKILSLLAFITISSASAQPFVLVTTGQLTDVARFVAGEHAEVAGMMGPGIDPHLYQATPRDVRNLQQADLILYHGLSLEGQLAEILDSVARLRPTAAVAELPIRVAELLASDDDGLTYDPHVWMDARLFSLTADIVARELAAIDPANEDSYFHNAQVYREQLEALHEWIATATATIPEETRYLVTAHDAFAYYGRAYDIDVAAVQGLSTDAEASVADISEIAGLIVDTGVPAVFVESTINPRTIQAVLEAVADAGGGAGRGGERRCGARGSGSEAEASMIGMQIHTTRVL